MKRHSIYRSGKVHVLLDFNTEAAFSLTAAQSAPGGLRVEFDTMMDAQDGSTGVAAVARCVRNGVVMHCLSDGDHPYFGRG